jgi:nickel-dependent lactate racemase
MKLRISAFINERDLEIFFPSTWDVKPCLMAGHDKLALDDAGIRKALQNPIGSPRIKDLAKGKKSVCILFDDIPKPTQPSRIVPFVIEELHAGGIKDDQIRFICAPGSHRPLVYEEFVAKLGRDIVEKYPVYNHSIWENLTYVGTTKRGTPVHVNKEYASCDLRLAIGSIFPHGSAGFGGGGKIILPGVCGIDTIEQHHKNMRENAVLGRVDDNVFRLDLEDAARLSGLHFKIDIVLNNHREAVAIFPGDLVAAHREGAKLASQLYKTEVLKNADIVVANGYPDESQVGRAMWCIPPSLKEGGDAVVLTHSWDGQNLHQLGSRFGTGYGGRLYNPQRLNRGMDRAKRILWVTPNLSKYDLDDVQPSDRVTWCKTWGEVMAELTATHGPGTKVAVYPYAPLQFPG